MQTQGVQVVGTFRGVEGDRFPKLVVEFPRPRSDKPIRREIEFRGFSPSNGEATEVGEALKSVQVGDLVAVGVFLDVQTGVYSNTTETHSKGDSYAFAKMSALWVENLTAQHA